MSGLEPSYENIIKQELEVADLKRVIAEKDREIANLQTCQCEGCDESLEGEAYCQSCWMKLREDYHTLMGQAIAFAEGCKGRVQWHDQAMDFLSSPEVRTWREQEGKK